MPYVIETPSDGSTLSKDFDPEPEEEIELIRLVTRPTKLRSEEIAKIPRTLIVGKPRKGKFPDILGWTLGPWIVSPRLREIIETLEPGVHDFVPIHVRGDDGTSDHGMYHLILLTQALAAVIHEETKFSAGIGLEAAKKCRYAISTGSGPCALDADIIEGHHLWRGAIPMQKSYFCSDELRDHIEVEGMRGWSFHSCKALKRQ